MPMIDPDQTDREIADAMNLIGSTDQLGKQSSASPLADPADTYELDEIVPPAPQSVTPAAFAGEPTRSTRQRPELAPAPINASTIPDGQIWTRWAEWWPATIRVVVALTATLYITSQTYSRIGLSACLLVLGFGLVTALLLAYPILITLERPVRFTPEQAVRDYFEAVSHIFPNHRRMWLLLSPQGRDTLEFGSLTAFRDYWRNQVLILSGVPHVSILRFEVKDFKSERGVGQAEVDITYRIAVTKIGQKSPIQTTAPIEATLTRGADRMWYLDEGRLKN